MRKAINFINDSNPLNTLSSSKSSKLKEPHLRKTKNKKTYKLSFIL